MKLLQWKQRGLVPQKSAIDSALVEAVSQVNGAEIARNKDNYWKLLMMRMYKVVRPLIRKFLQKPMVSSKIEILSESFDGKNHLVKLSVNISSLKSQCKRKD